MTETITREGVVKKIAMIVRTNRQQGISSELTAKCALQAIEDLGLMLVQGRKNKMDNPIYKMAPKPNDQRMIDALKRLGVKPHDRTDGGNYLWIADGKDGQVYALSDIINAFCDAIEKLPPHTE